MTLTEKIRWFRKGIELGKWLAQREICRNLTGEPVGEGTPTAQETKNN